MAHLIDKSAVVAGIKKRRKEWQYGNSIEAKYKKEECDDILSFLDTIEVKEVTTNDVSETQTNQFRDKIDEYLWKEHHILGGCCSSIESVKYAVAREVAEKLIDNFIEKARVWFEMQNEGVDYDGNYKCDMTDFEDFKTYIKR